MGLVFGIGTGLFSLGILWIIGIIVCLLLSRSGRQGGVIGICVLLILITIGMVFYPREDEVINTASDEKKDFDDMAIPRILYATLIALIFVFALLLYLVDHILMHNIALAAKVKKTYTF